MGKQPFAHFSMDARRFRENFAVYHPQAPGHADIVASLDHLKRHQLSRESFPTIIRLLQPRNRVDNSHLKTAIRVHTPVNSATLALIAGYLKPFQLFPPAVSNLSLGMHCSDIGELVKNVSRRANPRLSCRGRNVAASRTHAQDAHSRRRNVAARFHARLALIKVYIALTQDLRHRRRQIPSIKSTQRHARYHK
ncbi:hypothetical protein FCIRC_6777 [Fusarium circinatum]|uniref:Uncharacterized protein n=1 Tax=Fusarium circinatum TaxID=48490 RepID=A0A8H5TVH7_FUSCI|nr:hypothetical protein FCIRC_6777 [Fusarium circinatum]